MPIRTDCAAWVLLALVCLCASRAASGAPAVEETPVGPAPKGEVFVSPDGQRWATVLDQGETVRAVIDGQEQPAYNWILRHGVSFTGDSKHAVYQARQDGRAFTVVGKEQHRRYDEVGPFHISGEHVAYIARRGERPLLVLDGEESPASPGMRFVALAGADPIYIAGEIGKQHLVVRNKAYKTYEQVGAVALSPVGGRIAYRALADNRWHVVADEIEGPAFDLIGPIGFSADGKHLAYIARDGREWVVIVDNKEIARHPMVSGLALSADGTRQAYIVQQPRGSIVFADGRSGPEYDSVDASSLAYLGDAIAYIARKGNRSILVIDHQAVGEYDRIWTSGPVRPSIFAVKDGKLLRLALKAD